MIPDGGPRNVRQILQPFAHVTGPGSSLPPFDEAPFSSLNYSLPDLAQLADYAMEAAKKGELPEFAYAFRWFGPGRELTRELEAIGGAEALMGKPYQQMTIPFFRQIPGLDIMSLYDPTMFYCKDQSIDILGGDWPAAELEYAFNDGTVLTRRPNMDWHMGKMITSRRIMVTHLKRHERDVGYAPGERGDEPFRQTVFYRTKTEESPLVQALDNHAAAIYEFYRDNPDKEFSLATTLEWDMLGDQILLVREDKDMIHRIRQDTIWKKRTAAPNPDMVLKVKHFIYPEPGAEVSLDHEQAARDITKMVNQFIRDNPYFHVKDFHLQFRYGRLEGEPHSVPSYRFIAQLIGEEDTSRQIKAPISKVDAMLTPTPAYYYSAEVDDYSHYRGMEVLPNISLGRHSNMALRKCTFQIETSDFPHLGHLEMSSTGFWYSEPAPGERIPKHRVARMMVQRGAAREEHGDKDDRIITGRMFAIMNSNRLLGWTLDHLGPRHFYDGIVHGAQYCLYYRNLGIFSHAT